MVASSTPEPSPRRFAGRLKLVLLVVLTFLGGLGTAHLLPPGAGVALAQDQLVVGDIEELGLRWESDGENVRLTGQSGVLTFLVLSLGEAIPGEAPEVLHSAWITPESESATVPVEPGGSLLGVTVQSIFACDPGKCRFCNPSALCPFPPKPEPFPAEPGSGPEDIPGGPGGHPFP